MGYNVVSTETIEKMTLESDDTLAIVYNEVQGAKMPDIIGGSPTSIALDHGITIIPGQCRSSPNTLGCRGQASYVQCM